MSDKLIAPLNKISREELLEIYPNVNVYENGWIKCSDKLPEFEERVLLRIILNKEIYIMIGWNCNEDMDYGIYLFMQPPYNWHDDEINFTMHTDVFSMDEENVTHWMPLPPAPKDDE